MSTFRCHIVTPTEPVLDQQVSYVTFPAWDGQKGVMPSASPFLAKLGLGSMRVDLPGGANRWYLIEGGFAQMQNNVLTILTDRAVAAESLSVSDSEAELAAAVAEVAAGTARDAAAKRAELARARVALAKAAQGRGI